MKSHSDLIFDLGLHRGDDTDFYLRKGFRVVALKANPTLCANARERFSDAIADGRLTIVDMALDSEAGREAIFHLRPDHDDWGSLDPGHAERDGVKSETIRVPTTTLSELVARHGVPHYLKCDIEGADHIAVDQVRALAVKPAYVSVEASGAFVPSLEASGYDGFQIINQSCHGLFREPSPPREGGAAARDLAGHISGLFGGDLDPAAWSDAATAARRLALWHDLNEGQRLKSVRSLLKRYGKLTRQTWLVYSGWIDLHARHRSVRP